MAGDNYIGLGVVYRVRSWTMVLLVKDVPQIDCIGRSALACKHLREQRVEGGLRRRGSDGLINRKKAVALSFCFVLFWVLILFRRRNYDNTPDNFR